MITVVAVVLYELYATFTRRLQLMLGATLLKYYIFAGYPWTRFTHTE